ncbi:hypothetical protein KI387_001630, partial [Taxus chinensis]
MCVGRRIAIDMLNPQDEERKMNCEEEVAMAQGRVEEAQGFQFNCDSQCVFASMEDADQHKEDTKTLQNRDEGEHEDDYCLRPIEAKISLQDGGMKNPRTMDIWLIIMTQGDEIVGLERERVQGGEMYFKR